MKDDDDRRSGSYDVGYGKPPKTSQFRPGQSGNPRGRPRKPDTLRERVGRELQRKMLVRENGRERRIRKIDALIRRIITDALKGDLRAARLVLDIHNAPDDDSVRAATETSLADLAEEDRALLNHFLGGDPEVNRERGSGD